MWITKKAGGTSLKEEMSPAFCVKRNHVERKPQKVNWIDTSPRDIKSGKVRKERRKA